MNLEEPVKEKKKIQKRDHDLQFVNSYMMNSSIHDMTAKNALPNGTFLSVSF